MQARKHLGTILLMTSSVMLLLVLQGLWLRSAYNDELTSFSKETNSLFRSTILAMQDSIILTNLKPMATGDSARVRVYNDSTKVSIWNSRIVRDSIRRHPPMSDMPANIRFRDSTTQIQIFVSSTSGGDSLKQVLRPILAEVGKSRQPGNFVFRLGSDSLKITDVQKKYQDTLFKSGISLSPVVSRINLREWTKPDDANLYTEPFFLPHTPAYIASFQNIKPTLLISISPQIMFSIVLTAMIVTAFIFMYRSIRSQQRLMQLKNDLISNITHELKTPVATVSVALEALKNFKALDNPALTQEYLTIAQNELKRLTLMTDKILKTSAFEEKGLELKTESINLEKIIDDVLVSLKLIFEKHQAKIDFIKEGNDFTLPGNREHFTNVIYNLLDNAIKYSQPGCHIKISLKKDHQGIQLAVQDDGVGIPAEYQSKIFDKFFRVPMGDVHNAKGYGLGLSYVASVVKSMKGTIELKSEEAKGSIFTLIFPD